MKTPPFFERLEMRWLFAIQNTQPISPWSVRTFALDSMATNGNDEYDYDEIDDAILLQAEDGITYSPGSANSPPQSPVLPDPGAGLTSTTPLAP